jgi:ubiquitin carboxyl-terminal hydrolase 8
LSRLPPVLLIHLKRFQAKGPFTDKIETFVDFPLKGLDLTNYMPPPLPPGVDKSYVNAGNPLSLDDPRSQIPPYRYDLYGVTNHYGSLSSGHCEGFVGALANDGLTFVTQIRHSYPLEEVGSTAMTAASNRPVLKKLSYVFCITQGGCEADFFRKSRAAYVLFYKRTKM